MVHADLVQVIWILVDKLPINIRFHKIKRHQDNHVDYNLLDRLSQMNIKVDWEAKAWANLISGITWHPSRDSQKTWCCWINGEKITLDHSDEVWQKDKLCKFLGEKGQLSKVAFDQVDWDANEDTFKDLVPMLRLWATKHVSGHSRGSGSTHETLGWMGHQPMPLLQRGWMSKPYCGMPWSQQTWGLDWGGGQTGRLVCLD